MHVLFILCIMCFILGILLRSCRFHPNWSLEWITKDYHLNRSPKIVILVDYLSRSPRIGHVIRSTRMIIWVDLSSWSTMLSEATDVFYLWCVQYLIPILRASLDSHTGTQSYTTYGNRHDNRSHSITHRNNFLWHLCTDLLEKIT